MTVKELNQLYYLDKEIKILSVQKQKIEKQLEQCNTPTADTVQGSTLQIPFKLHSVKLSGITKSDNTKWLKNKAELRDINSLIKSKMDQRVIEYSRISRYIQDIDDSIIRIIATMRCIEQEEWKDIAAFIGGKNTEDSIKKIWYRFLDRI